MRLFVLFYIVISLQSCRSKSPSYFFFHKNQDWTIDFQNNSLPSKTLFKDKVYCSSIRVGQDNYLYCLNLKTGKVDWVTQVKNWATIPPIVNDSLIYYTSYTGDLYRLDLSGNIIWENKSVGVLKDISINPWNGNLMVTTLTNGLIEHDSKYGIVIKQYAQKSFAITRPLFLNDLFIIAGVKRDSTTFYGNLLVGFNANKQKIFEIEIGTVDNIFQNSSRVYFLTKDSFSIVCYDLENRKAIWRSKGLLDISSDNVFFTKSSIYCYGHDLNTFYEIDINNGNVKRVTSYFKLLEEGIVSNNIYHYTIKTDNTIRKITITDSLDIPIPLHSELNIYVE